MTKVTGVLVLIMKLTRKQQYEIMSTFESDMVYQEKLWNTYKRSLEWDICNIGAILASLIVCIITVIIVARLTNLPNVLLLILIYSMIALIYMRYLIVHWDIPDMPIQTQVLKYLNDVLQKNYKIIENNNVHLLKYSHDTLSIVVDGVTLKQKFVFQGDISQYCVQTIEYFVIKKGGHVKLCREYLLVCGSQTMLSMGNLTRKARYCSI